MGDTGRSSNSELGFCFPGPTGWGHQRLDDPVISKALSTFLLRTCPTCGQRLYDLRPCRRCGDGSLVLRFNYEDIPENWPECTVKIGVIERDVIDDKRSYRHRRSGRKDLEFTFRKKTGKDGRVAFEVLFIDRMKGRKIHRVHIQDGQSFRIEHDEKESLG